MFGPGDFWGVPSQPASHSLPLQFSLKLSRYGLQGEGKIELGDWQHRDCPTPYAGARRWQAERIGKTAALGTCRDAVLDGVEDWSSRAFWCPFLFCPQHSLAQVSLFSPLITPTLKVNVTDKTSSSQVVGGKDWEPGSPSELSL